MTISDICVYPLVAMRRSRMGRVAFVNAPGHEYQKYIRVEADCVVSAHFLAEAEASRHGWQTVEAKESPIGNHHLLCTTPDATKRYSPGF
jgi:hypothetical protein